MNVISISGTLGRDAEKRVLPDGTSVLSFSVADNQGKDKAPIWWAASLFGKRAESLSQYLLKGQSVTINGVVSERQFIDKEGNERKTMEVRVNDVALQGGKREEQRPMSQRAPAPPKRREIEDEDSDVPF